ncbi:MAG: thiolase family protein [Flavobacteriaceae bacterium]
MNSPVYIVSAKRTPFGSFGQSLSSVSATALGAAALSAALKSAHLPPEAIEEVFMGNVCSANLGQAPARQAALGALIPFNVPATTINKVCASGMKSIMLGAQSIALGQAEFIAAGGMENMSQIPYYAPQQRWGSKYGDALLIDGLAKDGLSDAFERVPMGVLADRVAAEQKISREAQDDYALASYARAEKAWSEGVFSEEVAPIEVRERKVKRMITQDEEYPKVIVEKVKGLKPAFSTDGSITAANASTLNDGACALILASEKGVKDRDLRPLARIVGYADSARNPAEFTLAPIDATEKLLAQTKKALDEIDLFEVNEAFAMVPLAYAAHFKLELTKINVHGGAVALGHPLGASGARIVTTLLYALKARSKRLGIAAICNGGGGASALMIELI